MVSTCFPGSLFTPSLPSSALSVTTLPCLCLSLSLFFFSLFLSLSSTNSLLLPQGIYSTFFLKAVSMKVADHRTVSCPCFGKWNRVRMSSNNENIIHQRYTGPAEKLWSDLICQNGVFRVGNRVKENHRHYGKCQVNCTATQSVHQIKAYSLASFSKKKTLMDHNNGCWKIARILQ